MLFRLSHTGTSSPQSVSEREFHSALDLATVSYKRRMATRFGRNWSLDGLKRVARSQSIHSIHSRIPELKVLFLVRSHAQ